MYEYAALLFLAERGPSVFLQFFTFYTSFYLIITFFYTFSDLSCNPSYTLLVIKSN